MHITEMEKREMGINVNKTQIMIISREISQHQMQKIYETKQTGKNYHH